MQIRPTAVSAQCPHCRSELPLGADQAAWLSGGKRSWLFCPLCSRIVAAEARIEDNLSQRARNRAH
jgi:hypothetical protein